MFQMSRQKVNFIIMRNTNIVCSVTFQSYNSPSGGLTIMPLDYSFVAPALEYEAGIPLAGTPLVFFAHSGDLCPFSVKW